MTPSPQQPIGIFDSGVGGLSIAAALHTLLPLEALVYFGDRANFPYGSRSEDEVRALACAATERLLQKERALGAAITFADIAPEVAGVYPRIMHDGDMDAGVWSCGMVAGLIHDVPTVAQLIAGIMDQAHALINERLAGLAR